MEIFVVYKREPSEDGYSSRLIPRKYFSTKASAEVYRDSFPAGEYVIYPAELEN